jgi:Protein of unknown function (DUF3617)
MSMKCKWVIQCIAGAIVFTGMNAVATAENLDVKIGLWETTVHSEMHGKMPISETDLAALAPQQRAALERMLAEQSKPQTHVVKTCLTQEKLNRSGDLFGNSESGMTCHNKVSRQTRDTFAGTMNCTEGSRHLSGDVLYHATDREHVAGTIHMAVTDGTKSLTTQAKIEARWLGSACGSTD